MGNGIEELRPYKLGAGTAPGPMQLTFEQLLECRPDGLTKFDVAEMNLACATGLPGAEDMDIRHYLSRLDRMAEGIRQSIDRDLPKFRANPKQYLGGEEAPESYFRIARLVTIMKENYGLHYNPERLPQPDRSFTGFQDSKDLLINGLLSDQRRGTCNSVPVMLVALGRRLGYPLRLTSTRYHVLARWDGNGERFNIDASCPGGFGDYDDEHYRNTPPMSDRDRRSGYYLKNFASRRTRAISFLARMGIGIQ